MRISLLVEMQKLIQTERSLPVPRCGHSVLQAQLTGQELHDRIASLEEALAQLAPRHALLATPPLGVSAVLDTTGNEIEEPPVHHGCLVVGEASEYTVYYGSASSLYLSVSHFSEERADMAGEEDAESPTSRPLLLPVTR